MTVPDRIDDFHGRWFFLSNFSPSPMTVEGRTWPTLEHAYAAAKTTDRDAQEVIRAAPTPGKAKRLGRKADLRDGWDGRRLTVMRRLLAVKFRPGTTLADRLLATGDAELVEGNTWDDRFFGCVRNADGVWVGHNHLGRLLMARRAQLGGPGEPNRLPL